MVHSLKAKIKSELNRDKIRQFMDSVNINISIKTISDSSPDEENTYRKLGDVFYRVLNNKMNRDIPELS
ncbi:MAG: hypothetical protein IPM42_03150 [Saprospiraceae bacterium]|nr:hypothetical protein [Saprospiraceae bacterium]